MTQLPKDQWGVVVSNYTELYSQPGDYTKQLRDLEGAVRAKPDDPALRFLLGFHYDYLGYPAEAVTELTKAHNLAPNDQLADSLLQQASAKAASAVP
jgi:tetratricopeptide (TPR) repeat protein